MKLLLCLLAAGSLWAQPGRGPAVRSPEVALDGKVTFRLRAPNAKEVAVTGIGQRLAMTKDEQGVWSATTEVLKPDFYTYMFNVDGLSITDPANGRFKTSFGSAGNSLLHVPGPSLVQPPDGPRGIVARHFYHSAL